jgi:hypothetical protein
LRDVVHMEAEDVDRQDEDVSSVIKRQADASELSNSFVSRRNTRDLSNGRRPEITRIGKT